MRKPKNKLSRALKRELISLSVILVLLLSLFIYLIIPEKEDEFENIGTIPLIKLVLLNGCGYSGIASDVKEYLLKDENSRFDIIAWRNVDRNKFIYTKSLIVVKKADEEKLGYLMKKTGIKRRIYATNKNSIEDFQIILGKDYQYYFSQE